MKRINKIESTKRKNLLLSKLDVQKRTANQIIEDIFQEDLSQGTRHVIDRGWKFYVHLNKLFSALEKEGRIIHTETNLDKEKVWKRV